MRYGELPVLLNIFPITSKEFPIIFRQELAANR